MAMMMTTIMSRKSRTLAVVAKMKKQLHKLRSKKVYDAGGGGEEWEVTSSSATPVCVV